MCNKESVILWDISLLSEVDGLNQDPYHERSVGVQRT